MSLNIVNLPHHLTNLSINTLLIIKENGTAWMSNFVPTLIYEYDTLTSEERWNEFADVILANPPFMSPKGGIKPHKRFSIQAKRSEVLFVDYMAEHLTPTGRAGIIVPEGIIFQSQDAYTVLRKMLVETRLKTPPYSSPCQGEEGRNVGIPFLQNPVHPVQSSLEKRSYEEYRSSLSL